jgi:hypothetical protein
MAIVVEEGVRKNGLIGIAGWLAFVAIVAGAAYYIFFAQPDVIPIPASGNLSVVAPLAQFSTSPVGVVQGKAFLSLKNTIPLPQPQGPAGVGRSNPFITP